jgi:hypothetical protein
MSNPAMRVVPLFLLCLLATAAHGGQSGTAGHPCAAVANPSERLECYDRAFPPTVDGATLADQARKEFGLTRADVRERNPALAAPPKPDQIEATVARIDERADGQRVITLDNGQVWLQVEAKSLGSLAAGDRVRIRQGTFSSYRLLTPAGVPLRVRRIK